MDLVTLSVRMAASLLAQSLASQAPGLALDHSLDQVASLGGFSVRGDGSVVNSAGSVIGRVDGSGNIIDTAGNIIGRVNPRN